MPSHSGNGRPPPNRIRKRHDQPKRKQRIQDKDMPAQRKFEPAQASLPGHMFQHAAELLSVQDMYTPAPSYANSFNDWRDAAEDIISEIIAANDGVIRSDQESFDVGKQVAFCALEKFVAKATAVGWAQQGAEARAAAAKELLERPQVPQRTQAWYAQGKQVLTASEFSKLLGTPRAVSQLVMSKVPIETAQQTNRLACMTCEMGPFDWGVRFEPVVKQILAEKWGAEIAESGRIMHPTDPHIAASPDGIIMAATDPARVGRLLEIKCPITRKIGEGVPFDYWCQMQVQMEVTGIDECEYVEVKLDSLQGTATDLSGETHGRLWLVQNPETCELRYAYTETELEGWTRLETIPWRLNSMYAVTVVRDRTWFKDTAVARAKLWEDVDKAKRGEFKEVEGRPKPKVVVTKEPACMID